jgi:hypothetical protein
MLDQLRKFGVFLMMARQQFGQILSGEFEL